MPDAKLGKILVLSLPIRIVLLGLIVIKFLFCKNKTFLLTVSLGIFKEDETFATVNFELFKNSALEDF